MNKKSNKRSGVDHLLLASLLSGATLEQAAKSAKVSLATAYRRTQDVEFSSQLAAARDRVLEQATGMLAAASTKAVEVLAKLLDAESASIRLAASRVVLESTIKLREFTIITARLAELERRLQEALKVDTGAYQGGNG